MTTLTGKKPKDTYKDLLQVSNNNAGIDSALRAIEDGQGTASALKLSSSQVSVAGSELVLDADGDTSIAAGTDDRIDIKLAGTDRLHISSEGYLGIGNGLTAPDAPLNVVVPLENFLVKLDNGDAEPSGIEINFSGLASGDNTHLFLRGRDSTTARVVIYADGDIQNVDGTYTTISDAALKEEIEPSGSQWDDVKAIAALTKKYVRKDDPRRRRQLGWVAQDIEPISPGLVRDYPKWGPDGRPTGETQKGIALSLIWDKAVKALGEAIERIEALEAEIAALRSP